MNTTAIITIPQPVPYNHSGSVISMPLDDTVAKVHTKKPVKINGIVHHIKYHIFVNTRPKINSKSSWIRLIPTIIIISYYIIVKKIAITYHKIRLVLKLLKLPKLKLNFQQHNDPTNAPI